MVIDSVNHINVIVRSLPRARAFLEGFLGLEPHSTLEGAYVIGEGEPLLVALEFPHAKDPIPDDRHQFGRAVVFTVASMPELLGRCRAHRLQPLEQVGPGQERPLVAACPDRVSVRDQDGNLWQFVASPVTEALAGARP